MFLAAVAGFAQNGANPFDHPPADSDKALRARISEFFQYHVTGEYRKAESLVAEDTKDLYYNGNKPKYFSFEIQRIDYSENYTRAKATVLAEFIINSPGFGRPMKFPVPSYWKLENGQWWWYVDQKMLLETPFGTRNPADLKGPQGPLPTAANIPVTADFAMGKVKADKSSVSLKQGEPAEVSFSNGSTGFMSVSIFGTTPGIQVTPERADLKAGAKATFKLKAVDGAKPASAVNFKVDPTGELLPIQVTSK
jgi:hypothetical protein